MESTQPIKRRDIVSVLAALPFFGGSIFFAKALPSEFNQAFFAACRYLRLPAAAAGVASGLYLKRVLARDHDVHEPWGDRNSLSKKAPVMIEVAVFFFHGRLANGQGWKGTAVCEHGIHRDLLAGCFQP